MDREGFRKFKQQQALIISEEGETQQLLHEILEHEDYIVSETSQFDDDTQRLFDQHPQLIIWNLGYERLKESNFIHILKSLYNHLCSLYVVVDRNDQNSIRHLYDFGIHQLIYIPLSRYEILQQVQLGLQSTFLHEENKELKKHRSGHIFPGKQIDDTTPPEDSDQGDYLQQLLRSFHASQRLFQTIFNGVHDAIILQNSEGTILDVNEQMLKLFGISEVEIHQKSFTKDLSSSKNDWTLFHNNQNAVMNGKIVFFEWMAVRHDNQQSFDAEIFYRKILLGSETMLLMSIRDISQRKKLEKQLREEAATDELTGIYNRRMFSVLYHELAGVARRYSHAFSFSLLDLDRFKQVNDTHGHLFGDEVLIQMAELVKGEIRESDIFGRFGGDEFSLAFPNTRSSEAKLICKRIIKKLAQHEFTTPAGDKLFITASIGISEMKDPRTTEDELFEQADSALYHAKSEGRNRIEIF